MAEIKDPENTIIMTLKDGDVIIQLLPDVAPGHVARMKELARAGAYDNVCFHRVIDGFMAQTGDVANGNMEQDFNIRRAGTGGSDLPDLKAEFSKLLHARGSIGAARSSSPDRPTASFSSISRIMISSTVSIPSTGRSFPVWTMSMPSPVASHPSPPTA